MTVIEHDVVIAGGGPTGVMLAAELTLAGVDVGVVERDAQRPPGARAGGIHARTIELLDQRGIVDRFLSEGYEAQVQRFADRELTLADFPTRHPYGLALWQDRFEEILLTWAQELGVRVGRGRGVTGFAQDEDGVDVQLSDGSTLRGRYLVGCDGGRSTVRRAAGIEFPGWDASMSYLIGELEFDGEPELGVRVDAKGTHAIGPAGDGRFRAVVREEVVGGRGGDPTLRDFSEELIAARGTDHGLRGAAWISRFTDATRQAASYRAGRVLLAGDAAHIHAPMGGQGLNLGLADAVNLGWKLARVLGGASGALLDTYEAERHPVAARAMRFTMAQTALARSTDRLDALRDTIADVVTFDEPRRHLAGMISGLDIHYDLGDGHPLLGRRMPDLDLGARHVYELLHEARPVLLNLGAPGRFATGAVPVVDADYAGAWELPVLGAVTAPDAVLVRPDGYVAWVGEGDDAGLTAALATWSGAR